MAKKPIYKITIDEGYADGEDLGISAIAFTANPAIKVKGMAFSSEDEKKLFFTDNTKMRIAAPALIPMTIYRNDDMGEYFVEFTADEIEKIHGKFMENLSNNGKFNIEHNDKNVVPAYILETWIVQDPLKDKAYSTFGIEVPAGTLMFVSQITDKEFYTSLVENKQIGYSIEGFLGLKLEDLINKKNKLNNMTLPNKVVFEVEGKQYVSNDGVISLYLAEAPADKKDETKKDETQKTDASAPLTNAVKTDETTMAVATTPATDTVPAPTTDAPVTDNPGKPSLDEAAVLSIIQPKLDEIYKMLADMKTADAAEDTTEDVGADVPMEVKMNVHERFGLLQKFIANKE